MRKAVRTAELTSFVVGSLWRVCLRKYGNWGEEGGKGEAQRKTQREREGREEHNSLPPPVSPTPPSLHRLPDVAAAERWIPCVLRSPRQSLPGSGSHPMPIPWKPSRGNGRKRHSVVHTKPMSNGGDCLLKNSLSQHDIYTPSFIG